MRFWLGSLTVPLGIVVTTLLERALFSAYDVPRLQVPPTSAINYSTWYSIPDFEAIPKPEDPSFIEFQIKAAFYGMVLALVIFVEVAMSRWVQVLYQ